MTNVQINKNDFGLASSPDTASAEFLRGIKEKRSIKKSELSEFERNFHMKFSRTYLEKIFKICEAKNIKIFFLYLPSYGSNVQIPKEYCTYIKYGKILIPPKKIFEKDLNWHDENHLNQTGAKELSNWLADEFHKQIQL